MSDVEPYFIEEGSARIGFIHDDYISRDGFSLQDLLFDRRGFDPKEELTLFDETDIPERDSLFKLDYSVDLEFKKLWYSTTSLMDILYGVIKEEPNKCLKSLPIFGGLFLPSGKRLTPMQPGFEHGVRSKDVWVIHRWLNLLARSNNTRDDYWKLWRSKAYGLSGM